MRIKSLLAALCGVMAVTLAHADIKVGVTLSATVLPPRSVSGEEHLRLPADHDRRPEGRVHRSRRCQRHHHRGQEHAQAHHEDKVDVVVGSTVTPIHWP